jgi:NADH dehydrogenase
MQNKRILVIGGSGYIGTEIVTGLIKAGFQVTILSRKPNNRRNVRILRGNCLDQEFLLKTIKGFDVVIYLAATVRSLDKSKYKQNTICLKNVIFAMKKNLLRKLVYFSTQNIYIKRTGPYGNSKKQSEKILLNTDLDYIILRLNYVYGIDTKNDFYRLFRLISNFRICPIIGRGKNLFEPINKEDVAAITISLVSNYKARQIYDLSGNKRISINYISNFIRDVTRRKFLVIKIPLKIMKFFSFLFPFDIEGYEADRLARSNSIIYSQRILDNDLNKIFKL